uniref:Retrotransposon gag domain-containing protein n=1 Tax=Oryza nivara TaxID=4536 RepID=A0A0E0FID1_ORYNI
MGHASTDPSASDHDAPARRRRHRRRGLLRFRRHRSPTPPSADPPTPELTPSPSAPPSYFSYPDIAATASYVVVATLPVFRGDPGECPDAHLARFDRVVNSATSPDAAARTFPASLDGDAALWYDLAAPGADDSPPPWDAVRAAFLDFFRPPGAADRARGDLLSMRQRPGEPVNRYYLRMQGILRRFPGRGGGGADVPESFLKSAFVDGLLPEFHDWVAPQRPEALDVAVALALSWERAESVREARRAAKAARMTRCEFCDTEGHEEAQCETRRRMRALCLRRSSSSRRGGASATMVVEEAAEEEGGGSMRFARLGSTVSTRSAQCQCRKHQCWKKAVVVSELAGDGEGR